MPRASQDTELRRLLAPHRQPFEHQACVPDLKEVLACIPPECFELDLMRSLWYAGRSTTMAIIFPLLSWMILPRPSLEPLSILLWIISGVCQGSIWMGCWVLGHECGHGAFCTNQWIQNAVGYVLHSLLLVPYYSWQRSHMLHHARTNHQTEGETHVPLVLQDKAMGDALMVTRTNWGERLFAVRSITNHMLFGWPAYLLIGATGSPVRGFCNHFIPSNHLLFPGQWSTKVWISSVGIVSVITAVFIWIHTVGMAQPLVLYVLPYLVTNAWLIVYTWLQHTDVDIPHLSGSEWTWTRGAFLSVDRPYPWLIDWLHHRIGTTHVAHHLCPRIPHYHARKATRAIQEAFPGLYLYDPTPIGQALWRVAANCVATDNVLNAGIHRYFLPGPYI